MNVAICVGCCLCVECCIKAWERADAVGNVVLNGLEIKGTGRQAFLSKKQSICLYQVLYI
jgi:hypothetical protein